MLLNSYVYAHIYGVMWQALTHTLMQAHLYGTFKATSAIASNGTRNRSRITTSSCQNVTPSMESLSICIQEGAFRIQ